MVTSLHDLSAVDLIAGFRAGQFSPTEVLEDVLAHIAVWEPHIKALYAFDPDGARAVAKTSTSAGRRASQSARSMACRPRSRRTSPPRACRCRWVRRPPNSCRRCGRAAGGAPARSGRGDLLQDHHAGLRHAVLGISSFHPLTRNPWDPSKNPGGSSAGAGAAAAAGYGPLHLGTDIGGSVRLPACWCGLVALKPSLGRIPIDPPYVGRVAGPMTAPSRTLR